ncbi:Protein srek1IP1 [Podochytrium sp. JEL0797]|nr:Protein srek1IP1 [Podochytrium sp. JEL0797]
MASVKVSNISALVSEATLSELFAHLGKITSIEMLGPSQFNANTREALVTFEEASAAVIAMHLTGTELGDHMLLVTSHATAAPAPTPANPAALDFMHPSRVAAAQMIHSTSLMGNALGVGVPGTNIKNPYVTTQMFQIDPVKADEIGRTIYVGNISLLISEADLTQMFSACGPVTFIKMAGDPAHGCRFAFVEFAVVDAANEAINLHGTTLAERPLKVTHSKNAINKGPKKLDDITMRRVREAELRILNRDKVGASSASMTAAAYLATDGTVIPPARRRRSRSRSRSYDRYRSSRDDPRTDRRSSDRRRSPDTYRSSDRDRDRDAYRSSGSRRSSHRSRSRDREPPIARSSSERRYEEEGGAAVSMVGMSVGAVEEEVVDAGSVSAPTL